MPRLTLTVLCRLTRSIRIQALRADDNESGTPEPPGMVKRLEHLPQQDVTVREDVRRSSWQEDGTGKEGHTRFRGTCLHLSFRVRTRLFWPFRLEPCAY
jgi:hypothetical protein